MDCSGDLVGKRWDGHPRDDLVYTSLVPSPQEPGVVTSSQVISQGPPLLFTLGNPNPSGGIFLPGINILGVPGSHEPPQARGLSVCPLPPGALHIVGGRILHNEGRK